MTRSPPDTMYDDDFFAWTQAQAAALRAVRGTLGAGVDIEHVAEEIEDLGKRDLREVESYLERLVEHLLKITHEPESPSVRHWAAEAVRFRSGAARAFSPSMRQRIDIDAIWRRATEVADTFNGAAPERPRSKEMRCPFALDELLSDSFAVREALRTLREECGDHA